MLFRKVNGIVNGNYHGRNGSNNMCVLHSHNMYIYNVYFISLAICVWWWLVYIMCRNVCMIFWNLHKYLQNAKDCFFLSYSIEHSTINWWMEIIIYNLIFIHQRTRTQCTYILGIEHNACLCSRPYRNDFYCVLWFFICCCCLWLLNFTHNNPIL